MKIFITIPKIKFECGPTCFALAWMACLHEYHYPISIKDQFSSMDSLWSLASFIWINFDIMRSSPRNVLFFFTKRHFCFHEKETNDKCPLIRRFFASIFFSFPSLSPCLYVNSLDTHHGEDLVGFALHFITIF